MKREILTDITTACCFATTIFTTRKWSLGQGNIFIGMCQEFCSQGGCLPQCMLGYRPPRSRHPPEQTPPTGAEPPQSRHPMGADTPLGADTSWEQTPPGSRPLQSRHPPGADTPLGADTPRSRPLRADTPGSRSPRACWEIRSMRGRYASYWNAISFENSFKYLQFLQGAYDVRTFLRHSAITLT